MKSQLHYLSASHCAAPVTFGSELPGVRTVCTVLPVPLSGVKSLFTLLGRLGVNSCIGLCYFHGLSSVYGGALKILGDGQLKSGHSFGSFSQNP